MKSTDGEKTGVREKDRYTNHADRVHLRKKWGMGADCCCRNARLRREAGRGRKWFMRTRIAGVLVAMLALQAGIAALGIGQGAYGAWTAFNRGGGFYGDLGGLWKASSSDSVNNGIRGGSGSFDKGILAYGLATPGDGALEDGALEDGALENGALEDGTLEDGTLGDAALEDADTDAAGLTPLQDDPSLASPANLLRSAGTGDLWDEWRGDTDFPGSGTKTHPYQISSLAQLMGLSEAVAAGEGYSGRYFELTRDISLDGLQVNQGNWNPIGWYQNRTELAGEVAHPFRGHFDGGGNTISGLRILGSAQNLKNIGLFGVVEGGSIKDLEIEADDIYGLDNAAILAGAVRGDTVISGVTVSGYVYSAGDAGGIAAEACGDKNPGGGGSQLTVENCRAEGIIINSVGMDAYVGGIAGNVQRAYLVDNTVLTQNGDSNRIQGNGYVGGIAGRMRDACIYNSYVNGTIGGNGTKAVGGIVGKYESGSLILARMAGDIARTNNASAKREGTFVGTRESRHNFTYGTEKDSHIAYLFTTSAAKAKQVFGSNIDGDNSFTESAHIGYWTDLERKYATVAGRTETGCKDRYFYEELEDGVRYIITRKLGKEFTADGYYEDLPFKMDHFAPGHMGEPIRGYLVSIPRIDARNANGTFDTDVASLTAISETGSSYYRVIDKDHAAAIAAGAVVTVATAPKNTGEDRYQMAADGLGNAGVKPPTYRGMDGNEVPMNYVNGGSYTFIMPGCDTELRAEYVKVTTKLTVDPAETAIHVIQARSGDRKHPNVVTEVKNPEGILIARYIDGERDQAVEVQPVAIHAEHNSTGQTADRTVRWSVDDLNLLSNQSENGYTVNDAAILPNLGSSFIQGIISREVQAQSDNQYREKISNTVYTKYAVVTASTNPAASANSQPVYGNCRVAVTFQIIDLTTVRVEGMSVAPSELSFTVTRKLTGNRLSPAESITCTEPVVLAATLDPPQPFLKQVGWAAGQNQNFLELKPSGANMQECSVSVAYDPSGQDNPAWIQNIINADREKKKADPMWKAEGTGICRETVTATSMDQTHGHVTADCQVTIRFVTVDETTGRVGSSGGSGGSSGGSGGSGSSGGSGGGGGGIGSPTAAAGTPVAAGPLPDYVVTGNWLHNAEGRWIFMDGKRTYANEWAAIQNPYANPASGQSPYDWFLFDAEGFLVTGWYTDPEGQTYYLHAASDGTLGRMYTGWNWIDGKCYYFGEVSDGTRGSLKRNFLSSSGKRTNQEGAWIENGIVQRQQAEGNPDGYRQKE